MSRLIGYHGLVEILMYLSLVLAYLYPLQARQLRYFYMGSSSLIHKTLTIPIIVWVGSVTSMKRFIMVKLINQQFKAMMNIIELTLVIIFQKAALMPSCFNGQNCAGWSRSCNSEIFTTQTGQLINFSWAKVYIYIYISAWCVWCILKRIMTSFILISDILCPGNFPTFHPLHSVNHYLSFNLKLLLLSLQKQNIKCHWMMFIPGTSTHRFF